MLKSTFGFGYIEMSGGRGFLCVCFGLAWYLGEGSINLLIAILCSCVYIYIMMSLISGLTFSLLLSYLNFTPPSRPT